MVLYMVIFVFELDEIIIICHPQIVVLHIFNILKDLAPFFSDPFFHLCIFLLHL
jgi:hypothetical protein